MPYIKCKKKVATHITYASGKCFVAFILIGTNFSAGYDWPILPQCQARIMLMQVTHQINKISALNSK